MREEEHQLPSLIIPGLPDEIALDCLVRVPYQFHSALKSVCHRWNRLLSHPSFYHHRRISHKADPFVCLVQALVAAPTPPKTADSEAEKKTHGRLSPPVYGITVYHAGAGTWHRMPFSPAGIPMFCQCVGVAGKLVLIGGWDPSTLDSVADVYVYDFVRGGGWRRGAPMSVARSFFACAAVGGAVYVAGGHDNQKNAHRSAEVYDVDEDTWRALPPMDEERDECQGLASGDGRFWVVSGYRTDRQGRFDSGAECYDPGLGIWTQVDGVWPFPNASPRGSCCETPKMGNDGKITKMPSPSFPSLWFVGNYQGLRRYDERDKRWKVEVAMPEGVWSSTCASLIKADSDRIFVIGSGGGEGGPHRFRGCVLDTGGRKWTHIDTPAEFSGFVYSASSLCL